MKEIEINGTKYYILGNNENICITTGLNFNIIKVENNNKKLNIKDCNQTLNDLVENDKMQSNLSLLEKCDNWLKMFYDVHDKFRDVVLYKGYRKKM